MVGTCPSDSLCALSRRHRGRSIRSYRRTRSAVMVASGRDLAVVYRGRGQDTTERNPTVGRVDMQLADPGFLIALGVALSADSQLAAGRRASPAGHLLLALKTARLLGPFLALAWAPRLPWAWRARLRGRFLTPLIAVASRDTADPAWCPAAPRVGGSARRRTGKPQGRFAGQRRYSHRTDGVAPGRWPTLAQRPGSVDLEHRLGDEGARQRRPILLRATAQATTRADVVPPGEHGDEGW